LSHHRRLEVIRVVGIHPAGDGEVASVFADTATGVLAVGGDRSGNVLESKDASSLLSRFGSWSSSRLRLGLVLRSSIISKNLAPEFMWFTVKGKLFDGRRSDA
jgi:hypothetical protein